MSLLVHQRCLNHSLREAAARCPECGQYYCRECITEHDDRVICAGCLKKLVKPTTSNRLPLASVALVTQGLMGLLAIWLFFYLIGSALVAIPAAFHEGTLWQSSSQFLE